MEPRDERARRDPGAETEESTAIQEIATRLADFARRLEAWQIEPDSSYAGARNEFVTEYGGIQDVIEDLRRFDYKSEGMRLVMRYSDGLTWLGHIRDLRIERDKAAREGALSAEVARQLDERAASFVARAGEAIRRLAWELGRARDIVLGQPAEAAMSRDPSSGVRSDGEIAAAPHTSMRRRAGGRPRNDPDRDRQIWEAWKTRQHRTYADLAREMCMTPRQVELALDRQRHREQRPAPPS